ncbi:MAG: hypothetical protein Q4C09_09325 [Atopobiaceae bacterium]|nr:hypothetical protein [Atopobiaceae bacterium]
MRKYARLLASYAAIAITGMVLYTPWLVGLTPSDPSILRAGLSVISGILLTVAFGASTYAYLKEPEYRLLESSEVNEPDDVLPQLRQFTELPAVGGFAAEAVSQIESMDRRHRRLNQVIDSAFGPESLSHDKFVAVVDATERTLLKNCALLSNRIQAFDVDGYRSSQRRLLKPADTDTLGEERQRVYNDALDDMRQVIDANERLLLEMGKLEMELSDLESDDNREDNTQMLEEVQGLLEQTKYYR